MVFFLWCNNSLGNHLSWILDLAIHSMGGYDAEGKIGGILMKKIRMLALLVMPLFFLVGYMQPAFSSEEGMVISDKMTYGMAKKHIKIGETTQADILKLFGSADNMVMNNGKETWVYDKFRVESESNSSSGYGTILLAGASSNKSSSSTHTRTLTVIVKFDKSGVVEDYNMREGGY